MRIKRLLIAVLILQLVLGLYTFSHYPIEDVAIHGEIVNILRDKGVSLDYQPYSNTTLTYPVLFHYLSLPFSYFMNAVYAVRIIGLIAFVLFPYFMYLLGKTFDKKIGILSLILSMALSNFAILIVYSGMPQILAMDFFVLFMYFYFSKRYKLSGLFLGLITLTHPFMGIISWASAILLLAIYRDKKTLKTILIGAGVSLLWVYQYYLLFNNITSGIWNNVKHYNLNPGFIGFRTFIDYMIRLNGVLFLISLLAINFKNKKRTFFSIFFLMNLFFVVYHYPPAQLKFLDLFTIPIVLFGAIGLNKIIKKFGSKTLFIAIFLFLIVSCSMSLMMIYDVNQNYQAINDETIKAAKFLNRYDSDLSKIVYFGEPKTEIMFGIFANKIPMDAKISDLEAYSSNYKKRLVDREEIINGHKTLHKRYGIKYVVSQDCTFDVVYDKKNVKICQLY